MLIQNIFIKILIIISLVGCADFNSVEEQIKSPIILVISVIKGGVEFIKQGSSGIFAVTNDGKNYTYKVCNNQEEYTKCINEGKYKLINECRMQFNKPCEIIAVNDQIVYPGEIDIMNKKFTRGDRINYFTVPALRDADKYMESQEIDINSLPDVFAEEY